MDYINFNPRTPRGVRLVYWQTVAGSTSFQSTHPARGATLFVWDCLALCDFNPRTPRGVRLAHGGGVVALGVISIHAPREGCDSFNQGRI